MIEVNNLVKRYGDHTAVDHLSFKIEKGKIYGFLGPNGAGKSTTMNMITGYIASTEGTVTIDGHDILEEPEQAKKCIGYLPEMPPLYFDMTVLEYMNFVADLKKIPKDKKKSMVAEVMEMVKITDMKKRLIKNLSKGYRQRVGLAQALLGSPEILILDEPTSFLDVKHKLELLAILEKMAREKKMTVIMSLHEIDLAQKVSDKIVCVQGENISHFGKPEEVFQEEIIRDLYGITNGSFDPRFGSIELPGIKGEPEVLVISSGGSGIPVYRKLRKERIPFAAGILYENDIDCELARQLAVEVITEKAFEEISDETFASAEKMIERCGRVIDAGVQIGTYNRRIGELLEQAERLGKLERAGTLK